MKTVAIDTNVLVTLKLKREPGFSESKILLEKCLEGKVKLFIPTPALLETEWVLRSVYKQTKEKIIEFFEELLLIDNQVLDNLEETKSALNLYRDISGINFTDCLIITQVQNRSVDEFLTLDKELDKLYKTSQ